MCFSIVRCPWLRRVTTRSVHYFLEALVYPYALVYKALPNPFRADLLPSPRGEEGADRAIPC